MPVGLEPEERSGHHCLQHERHAQRSAVTGAIERAVLLGTFAIVCVSAPVLGL